jgi:putative membrane protein
MLLLAASLESLLPHLNASLNGLSAVLLACGYAAVRRKRIGLHQGLMLSAFGSSTLFLASYLLHQFLKGGPTYFPGSGAVRWTYFAILGSHTVLAIAVVPLALRTLYLAARGRFDEHRRIARWTLPAWFYVSVTGVVVYAMLYHLYPAR